MEHAEYLLTAQEMTEADRYTSEVIGIPSLVLMERAALGVAREIMSEHPDPGRHAVCAVIAGKGNNGADAVAAGRLLLDKGYEVTFYLAGHGGPAGEAMERQLRIVRSYGITPDSVTEDSLRRLRPDIIIDGLFGTGLSREVGEPCASAVRIINQLHEESGARVYSVDIPSGIDGTTGRVMGTAVRADVTVTFAFYKRGHYLYPGAEYCGRLVRHEIGITERSLAGSPGMFTYRKTPCGELLPPRIASGNKGTFGKVLVIAGSEGVSGACTMCARAVLRMGAGMVKIFTHERNRVILQETVPEAMCSTYGGGDTLPPDGCASARQEDMKQLLSDLAWADVAVIGPGMGRGERASSFLSAVLACAADCGRRFGLLIDADAVRLIADDNLYDQLYAAGERAEVILTPHMAECAALLRVDLQQLRADALHLTREFTDRCACTLVMKDARTLITSHTSAQQYLNTSGNDGLATAGSGDILSGIGGACLAQGMRAFPAACAASYIHGRAADELAKTQDRRTLIATDLLRVLGA